MGSVLQPTPVKILIAGCSYAGMSTAVNLLDLSSGLVPRMGTGEYEHLDGFKEMAITITIVDERDGFYHLIGSPLAFASSAYAANAWVKFGDIPALQRPNVRFLQGSVARVDPAARTAHVVHRATGETHVEAYDYLVAATGLRRAFPVVPQSLTRKAYLLEVEEHVHAVSNAPLGVVVVGGGAVGIEMAAELKLVKPEINVTLLHSREKLLSAEALPDECKDKTLEVLRETGVNVILGKRLAETSTETKDGVKRVEITLSDGSRLVASEVVMAISKPEPSTSYLPASALNEEGYAIISSRLSMTAAANPEHHYAAGDLVRWSGIKRCGTAMHMGTHTAINIHQTMLQKLSASYEPKYLGLTDITPNIGLAVGNKAVAYGEAVGTISGTDVMQMYFRDDLGLAICWEYMKLSSEKWKDRLAARGVVA